MTSRASSSSGARSRTEVIKDAYPINLPPSTRGLILANDAKKLMYKSLSARMTREQNFLHMESLQTLGVYDDMRTLLGNLGLLHFVDQKCVTYDQLI